ncbi:MAG: hypothetical protein H0V17_13000 [Deltaproteobacteria bacterium]|nr:hypothetical protein [Deltaproteobacteria bacterium]
MTHPIQGPSTWARTTRLAELEWGMSRKRVLAMFSTAQTYPRHESTNSVTREPVIVRECVMFAAGEATRGVKMFGSVTFDEEHRVDSITLKSEFPRPEGVTEDSLRVAANEVAAALGVEALPSLPAAARKWKVHKTLIELDRDDDCFWFELAPA